MRISELVFSQSCCGDGHHQVEWISPNGKGYLITREADGVTYDVTVYGVGLKEVESKHDNLTEVQVNEMIA